MINYKKSNMYCYISETKDVLLDIMMRHDSITKDFVSFYKDIDIQQLYIVGSGTSYHSGLAVQSLFGEIFQFPIHCAYPIFFKNQESVYDKHTLVIGVSQGGQSFSTVNGLDGAKEKGLYTAALSANPTARIFEHAQVSTRLEVGDEFCGAKTKGYAATILTLMFMGMDLAIAKGILSDERYSAYLNRMKKVITNLSGVLNSSINWIDKVYNDVMDAQRIIVVGYDYQYPNVLEGALKILETLRIGVEGYELEEFMHGIYNSVNENTHIFYLGFASQYRNRIQLLYENMSTLTKHNYMINAFSKENLHNLVYPFSDDPLFSIWEYIIPLQVLSCVIPIQKGINPDIPSDPQFHSKMNSK